MKVQFNIKFDIILAAQSVKSTTIKNEVNKKNENKHSDKNKNEEYKIITEDLLTVIIQNF